MPFRRSSGVGRMLSGNTLGMNALLFVLAAILAVVGVVQLLQGQIIFGIVLLVAACLVGPGGYSIFRGRSATR